MGPRMRRGSPLGVIALAMLLVGCAGTGDGSDAADGGTTVGVTLQEWAVVVDTATAPAGEVTFDIRNDGPEDVHEFVVIRTDLDPGGLPVDENGVVLEDGEGMEVIGEVEDIPVDDVGSLTLSLDAGGYVLVCNIWSEDEGEAHYMMGMRTAFTVEE